MKEGKNEGTEVKDGENDKTEVKVEKHEVEYAPGESNSDMFGGNSNWRGPIWICSEFFMQQYSTNQEILGYQTRFNLGL